MVHNNVVVTPYGLSTAKKGKKKKKEL
jgi:hypothetical protein